MNIVLAGENNKCYASISRDEVSCSPVLRVAVFMRLFNSRIGNDNWPGYNELIVPHCIDN